MVKAWVDGLRDGLFGRTVADHPNLGQPQALTRARSYPRPSLTHQRVWQLNSEPW